MTPQTYETAEDLATEKRMAAQSSAGKAASPAQPVSRQQRSGSKQQPVTRASHDSGESGSRKDSGYPGSQKRQWKAPGADDDNKSDERSPKPSKSSALTRPV